MKINDRYEIRVVVVEEKDGLYCDCYDNFENFRKEHPYSSYIFGFIVYDTVEKTVPLLCNDWNDSPEEAMFDYRDNVEMEVEY